MRSTWVGNIGRNGKKRAAPAMLNMLPKFELEPIRMYLVTFSTVRRPSITPSRTTSRSCSSSTRSAASLATSAAPSTEMPTSAAWSAEASLMPSPRKPTTLPERFRAERIRSFCCGATRQNRLVEVSACAQRLLGHVHELLPCQGALTSTPISLQICRATCSLSPVKILTSTPIAARAVTAARSVGFRSGRQRG